MHVIQNIFGPNFSFEVHWKCHQVALSKKCLRPCPSAKTSDKNGWIGFFQKCIIAFEKSFLFWVLERQEGKIRNCLLFYAKITVWFAISIKNFFLVKNKTKNFYWNKFVDSWIQESWKHVMSLTYFFFFFGRWRQCRKSINFVQFRTFESIAEPICQGFDRGQVWNASWNLFHSCHIWMVSDLRLEKLKKRDDVKI